MFSKWCFMFVEKFVEIKEGVTVTINNTEVTIKGPKGELKRDFGTKLLKLEQKDGQIRVYSENVTKKGRAIIGTVKAHLNNMIRGVTEEFTYNMGVVFSHFPMNVAVKGSNLEITNFFGEKKTRVAKIVPPAKVQVKGKDVTVTSIDIESAGQTAANIERATVQKQKDSRKFQDGIYITQKP